MLVACIRNTINNIGLIMYINHSAHVFLIREDLSCDFLFLFTYMMVRLIDNFPIRQQNGLLSILNIFLSV